MKLGQNVAVFFLARDAALMPNKSDDFNQVGKMTSKSKLHPSMVKS
jgi:hypothetical protein